MINKSCFLKYPFSYSSLIIYIGLIFVFIPIPSLAQIQGGEDALPPGDDFSTDQNVIDTAQDPTPAAGPMASSGADGATKKGNRFGIYSFACTTIETTVLNQACNQKAYESSTKPVMDRIRQMQANNSNGSQKDQCQIVQQANEKVKEMNQAISGKCYAAIATCLGTCAMALKNANAASILDPTAALQIAAIVNSTNNCRKKRTSFKKATDLQVARNTKAIKQAKDCVDGLGGVSDLSGNSNCNQLSLPQKNLCQQLGEVAFCKQHPKIDFCHNVLDSLFAGKTDAPGPGHTNANATAENPLKQTLTGGGGRRSRQSIATRLSHV